MGASSEPSSSDIAFGVIALAAAIRTGRTTCELVAQQVLDRCDAHRELNALISQDPEALLRSARAADAHLRSGLPAGPLHGVPILIKDNIDVAGYPTSAGTPGLAGVYPREHAPLVKWLIDAGALIAGKANLHELAVGGTSHNDHFGRVINPWRSELVAGGSSGGSAVAVAARLVPAALGTDTNGSVRGPCSFQGIAGFRPSFARYAYGGTFPATPTRDAIGPMAATVADLVLLDQVLSGERDQAPAVSLRGLRLGKPGGRFHEVMDSRTADVFAQAVSLLERAGAEVIPTELPGLHELAAKTAWPISAWEVVREVSAFLSTRTTTVSIEEVVAKIASPVVRERFNPLATDANQLERAWREAMHAHRPRLQQLLADHFAQHRLDALIFPTTPFPAVAVANDLADLVINGRHLPQGFGYLIQNTVYQSASGIPSLTVPAGLTVDGLPVGLNFDGPMGTDRRLLAIGLAFEELRGPFPAPARCASASLTSGAVA
jgi:mandelamide amidase